MILKSYAKVLVLLVFANRLLLLFYEKNEIGETEFMYCNVEIAFFTSELFFR